VADVFLLIAAAYLAATHESVPVANRPPIIIWQPPPLTMPAPPPIVDPNIYARKSDLEKVDYIADKYGVDRHALGDLVHEEKESRGRYKGRRPPDLTTEEIEELAKELPKIKE
jgi:hypothetical protein